MRNFIVWLLCGIIASHLYAMPCYVAEVDEQYDLVCFCDYAYEDDWWWDGVEDWHEGDGANLVMFDNFTAENKYDDVIIRATYDRQDLYVEYLRGAENND